MRPNLISRQDYENAKDALMTLYSQNMIPPSQFEEIKARIERAAKGLR